MFGCMTLTKDNSFFWDSVSSPVKCAQMLKSIIVFRMKLENGSMFVINSSVWWLLAVTLVKVMLAVIRNGSVNRLTEEQGVHFCTKKDLHVTGSQLLAALLLWSSTLVSFQIIGSSQATALKKLLVLRTPLSS